MGKGNWMRYDLKGVGRVLTIEKVNFGKRFQGSEDVKHMNS